MDITTLAAWGEFLGGIAVVVSLVYLAGQIRQNSRLIQASPTAATQDSEVNYLGHGTLTIALIAALSALTGCAGSGHGTLDLRESVAKHEILEAISQYSHAWDTKNADSLSAVFTEDATWEAFAPGAERPGVSLGSRSAIATFASERFRTNLADRQTRHYQTNTVFLELTDVHARTRTMILIVHKVGGEKQPRVMTTGIYNDELQNTLDGWKIHRRTLVAD